MKSLLVVITTVIALGFLSSCSKDFECVCYEGLDERGRYAITDQHEKGAKEQCQEKQNTLPSNLKCNIE
jgi:hypothetical protein